MNNLQFIQFTSAAAPPSFHTGRPFPRGFILNVCWWNSTFFTGTGLAEVTLSSGVFPGFNPCFC